MAACQNKQKINRTAQLGHEITTDKDYVVVYYSFCNVFSCMLDYDTACDAAVFSFLKRLRTRGALNILLTMVDIDTLFIIVLFLFAVAGSR